MAIGTRMHRVEDRPLLIGSAEFVDDVASEGMLEAAFVRSPVAHGVIRGVDLGEALDVEGVEAVFTAADLDLPPITPPNSNPAVSPPDQPILAVDRVRFAGEPVAVVLARSRYIAEDAAESVFIDVEPLEALTSPERALEAGAPEIHPGSSNTVVDFARDEGDVDAAFAAAASIVEREIVTPRQSAAPIEARAVLATPQAEGVHLHCSSQAPHKARQIVAEVLGLDRSQVRVSVPDVGGGFGLKAHTYPEEIATAACAMRVGRPVKWTEDRAENFASATHARAQKHRVRMAADEDGVILALDVEMICDQGAYGAYPHGVSLEALTTSGMLPGPYTIRNFRLRCRTALTNKSPEGAYRGVGFVVSTFVHERMIDALSAETGIDRVELRRRNLIPADAFPYTSIAGQTYDNGDYGRALKEATAAIGYRDSSAGADRRRSSDGRLVGVGVATYVEPTGMNSAVFSGRGMVGIAGFDDAHVTLEGSGQVTVWTTTPAIGQGTDTTMAQVAARYFGTDVAKVKVARADTAIGDMHGTGSFASRSAVSAAGAVKDACETLRRRLTADAAEQLEAAEGDLELGPDGQVRVAGSPGRSVAVEELVAAAPERYRVSSRYDPPAAAYPYATHACVVAVDPATGQVEVERYVVAEDCGVVINPEIADGQVMGAVAQGIGGALFESHDYDQDGQLRTSSLMDYLVPTASEIPRIESSHLEIPSPTTWGGVKGVGEGGTIGAGPAVVNAVCDAVGSEFNHFPVTPEQIVAALAAHPHRDGSLPRSE